MDMEVMKFKVCHPSVCIYILRCPILNFSTIMHLPKIANMIKISFLICCVHYLLHGNTTDIQFEDECSLVSEFATEDED
jgi:hypothetical protein